MVSPSEASVSDGIRSLKLVRYHEVPAVADVSGTLRVPHDRSAKPGSDQPFRSPYRPPLLSGPRTGSTPAAPWMRHDTAGTAPSKVTPISPRPSLWASFTPPS